MKKLLFIVGLCALLACENDDVDDLKKDIEELKEQVDQNTKDIASLQTQFTDVTTQIDEIGAKQTKTDQDIKDLQDAYDDLRGVCDQLTTQIETLNDDIEANQKEIDELSKDYEANKEKIEELTKQIEANKKEIEELNQFMADNKMIYLPNSLQQIKDADAAVVFGNVDLETPEQAELISGVKHILGTLRLKKDFDGKLVLPKMQTIIELEYRNDWGQSEKISEIDMPELQSLLDWEIRNESQNIFEKVLMPKLLGNEELYMEIYVSKEIDLSSLVTSYVKLYPSDENTEIALNDDLSKVRLNLVNADLYKVFNNNAKTARLNLYDCTTSEPVTILNDEFLMIEGGQNSKLTVKADELARLNINVRGESFKMCQLEVDVLGALTINVYQSAVYLGRKENIELPELDNVKTIGDCTLAFQQTHLIFTGLNGNYESLGRIHVSAANQTGVDLNAFNGVQKIKGIDKETDQIYFKDYGISFNIFNELISSETEIEIDSHSQFAPNLCCMKKYLEQDETTAPFTNNRATREELLAACSAD